MKNILCYTRLPQDDRVYANRLAYSMHLALEQENGFVPLNHNSGVLFVKATENEDGSLNPKSIKSPKLFQKPDGGYGVIAIRVQADGQSDDEDLGSVVLFETNDLLHYTELGLCKLADSEIVWVDADYDALTASYCIRYEEADGTCYQVQIEQLVAAAKPCDKEKITKPALLTAEAFSGEIEGVVPEKIIEIEDVQADYLEKKLLTPVNCGVTVPQEIVASKAADVEKVKATLLYTDTTTVERRVNWELSGVDFQKPGTYPVTGTLVQEHFAFPIAYDRADPCVAYWHGKYYFIATNDADNNHTLYMRCSDTMEGLVTAEETLILDSETYPKIGGLLWAPEFHEIDGKLYIFHAATPGPFFCEESHVIMLKEGGDPMKREDWSAPQKILKADGTTLCDEGNVISLDMTEFEWEGSIYVIWSQRQFLPKDLGAWLYIAKLDPQKPWMLLTEPVVLSKPEYGWANNHTFVDEGPFALKQNGKLYITFSSAAVDSTYVVGLLTMEPGKDLLVPQNWTKTNYPILTSRSVAGEYGTGHNAYVTDEYGITWNTYHARPGLDAPRSSGIRRVHFDIDGEPVLDVTEELDILKENKSVSTNIIVK